MASNPKPEIVAGTEIDPLDVSMTTATTTTAPDPFNEEALRLPPNFMQKMAGAEKVLENISVRKPNDQEWFAVHPDPAYRRDYAAIKLKAEGEFYLLTAAVAAALPSNEVHAVTIYTVMTKTGTLMLWAARLPSTERRTDKWATSAHEAAIAAMSRRIKMVANQGGGFYEWTLSPFPLEDSPPDWSLLAGKSFHELLRIGFVKTGRFVHTLDHPVIKLLHEG